MVDLDNHLISRKMADQLAAEYENTNYEFINKARSSSRPDSKSYTCYVLLIN